MVHINFGLVLSTPQQEGELINHLIEVGTKKMKTGEYWFVLNANWWKAWNACVNQPPSRFVPSMLELLASEAFHSVLFSTRCFSTVKRRLGSLFLL